MMAACERMELYFRAMRNKIWVAVLGQGLYDSIKGFGTTVEAALADFDGQYLRALRPPKIPDGNPHQRAAAKSTARPIPAPLTW